MPKMEMGKFAKERGLSSETEHVIKMLTVMEKDRGLRKRPYASTIAYCPREAWMHANVLQGDKVLPPTLSLYQGIGNGVEERIVDSFEAHGNLLGKQVRMPNPPGTFKIESGGYIDMVALNGNGKVAAYEIKTASSLPSSPKGRHLAQAMAYGCLGGFDHVYVLYVERKVQNWPNPTPLVKAIELDVQALLPEYMTTIVLTGMAMHSHEAPMRPAHFRQSNECSYRPLVDGCWNQEFRTRTPQASLQDRHAAERIAEELIAMRPQFYKDSLTNALPTCPTNVRYKLEAELKRVSA